MKDSMYEFESIQTCTELTYVPHSSNQCILKSKKSGKDGRRHGLSRSLWKKEYRNIFRACKDDLTRKAKSYLELNLMREIKGNKKDLFKNDRCKKEG